MARVFFAQGLLHWRRLCLIPLHGTYKHLPPVYYDIQS
jgi:hypothetical protein